MHGVQASLRDAVSSLAFPALKRRAILKVPPDQTAAASRTATDFFSGFDSVATFSTASVVQSVVRSFEGLYALLTMTLILTHEPMLSADVSIADGDAFQALYTAAGD